MNTFIIRVYRHEKDKLRSLAGIVEEVGVEEKTGFTNYDELWKILNAAERQNKSRGNRYQRKRNTT